jgi:hypothetical protein
MAKWKSAHPGLIHGYQILGNAGTVVCLDTGTSSELIKAITVVAMDNNSSQILIGSSDLVTSSQVRGFDSGKGLTYDPINIPPVKLSSFYINGGASSDGVDFYAIKA